MAKEIKKEELENEAAEAAEQEETVPVKKEKKKLSWKKKLAIGGAAVGAVGLGILAKVLKNRSYAKGVADTTSYYEENPVTEYIYLPASAADEDSSAETESATETNE